MVQRQIVPPVTLNIEDISEEVSRLYQVERNYHANITKHLGYIAEAERRMVFAQERLTTAKGFGDEPYWRGKVDAYAIMLETLKDEL